MGNARQLKKWEESLRKHQRRRPFQLRRWGKVYERAHLDALRYRRVLELLVRSRNKSMGGEITFAEHSLIDLATTAYLAADIFVQDIESSLSEDGTFSSTIVNRQKALDAVLSLKLKRYGYESRLGLGEVDGVLAGSKKVKSVVSPDDPFAELDAEIAAGTTDWRVGLDDPKRDLRWRRDEEDWVYHYFPADFEPALCGLVWFDAKGLDADPIHCSDNPGDESRCKRCSAHEGVDLKERVYAEVTEGKEFPIKPPASALVDTSKHKMREEAPRDFSELIAKEKADGD